MTNIEELKIEFEEKFYYDDDDESNILIASKKDIWEWIKNKVQQQVKVEPEVKPEIAVIESAKQAINKAHTLALKFAVLRGNRVYDDEIYADWQKAHIEFQEALKQFSV